MLPFLHTTRKASELPAYQVDTYCQIPRLPDIYKHYFGLRNQGIFVEVGAMDGQMFSNTCGLADRGWSGLYIEPVPDFFQKCRQRHKKNKVKVLNCAVSDQEGTLRLHLANALTTGDPLYEKAYEKLEWAKHSLKHKYIDVPTKPLDTLLQENQIPTGFDVLVIDVEGHELSVLKGFSLEIYRPKMIIIEIEDEHPDMQHLEEYPDLLQRHKEIRSRIENVGYKIIYKDHINSIYIL